MKRIPRFVKRLCWYLAVGLGGFIGGALVLYISIVRSGPPLEIWHTEKLKAEFTADMAGDEIGSFEDYLKLEDDLFLQLDDQIYGQTDSGPETVLARYSGGSLADPRDDETNWNRSFELPAESPKGNVLLLHGMSDSPYSLRVLGRRLNQQGYRVLGLRLPGHGTVPSGLLRTTWEDMAAAVKVAANHLTSEKSSKPLHLVGFSTGAPLALQYVLECLESDSESAIPESLVLISPSIGITPAAALASWKRALSNLPGLEKFAWTGTLPEFDPFKYNSFTTNAGDQVHRLTSTVAAGIGELATDRPIADFPRTLVFLSAVDATVSTDAVVDNLLGKLEAGRHELVLFDINRNRIQSSILVSDPGPLTARLLADDSLPFYFDLITNENPDSMAVVSRRKNPMSTTATTVPLNLTWPEGVLSLSHIALPFPPDDPLYGRREFSPQDGLRLGQISVQGERNLLKFPADWLLRLRYNPFYSFLEDRTVEWIEKSGDW